MMVVEGIISQDVLCTTCGYNLRTQHADGVCPECNASVAISLASPVAKGGAIYLKRMGWAVGFSGWLNVGLILLIGLVVPIVVFLSVFSRGRAADAVVLGFFVAVWVFSILHIWPVWILTREPSKGLRGFRELLLRVASMLTMLTTFVPVLLMLTELFQRSLNYPHWIQTAVKALIGTLIILLPSVTTFFFCYASRVGHLCQSSGNIGLAWWHRWTWRVPALGMMSTNLGLLIVFPLILDWIHLVQPVLQWIAVGTAILVYGGLLIAMISLPATAILLFRTAKCFRQQAREMETLTAAPAGAADSPILPSQ